MRKVVVIGGGAAGMLSAYSASFLGKKVVLLEKNEKLGKKVYITGKGRCNLTNDVPVPEFFNFVVSNPKFTFSAVNCFSPKDLQDLFENLGLTLKTERGNRVFPLSDKASDVTKTLEKALKINNVDVKFNSNVEKILIKENVVVGVVVNGEVVECDSVIVCTGGISYPLTGSTGDGYKFAKELGHSIIEPKSALVGIELLGSEFMALQGLSLKNVSVDVLKSGKSIYSDFGEMLFTHFGVSGPIILSASSIINRLDFSTLQLKIDLKPALNEEVLENRLLREFKENKNKSISNVVRALLPKALVETILFRANISLNKNCSQITVEERKRLVETLKNYTFKIKKLRPIEEAIVTAGGVNVREINPKTMESKIVNGLFFAGEVLDIDAFTGGFNLQLAFSTGYVAGQNA